MEEWTVGCRAVLKTVARNGLQVRILSLPQNTVIHLSG